MRAPCFILLAALLPALAWAESSSQDQAHGAIEQAKKNNTPCVVSPEVDKTSNLRPEQRAPSVTREMRSFEFRRGGCPSEEKRQAESRPPGR